MLFDSPLPKASASIRTAFAGLVGNIRNKVETTLVRNPNAVTYPIGTIVSFVELVNGSTDYPAQVRPTTANVNPLEVPVAQQCKQQFCGLLEAPLPAGSLLSPESAIARHNGGPVRCRLIAGLTLHVGDAIWATNLLATVGMGSNVPIADGTDIYIGMVRDLGTYNTAAADGTTYAHIIVKHEAPAVLQQV